MNQITSDPNDYDFGLDFNYEVWSADSVITLTSVPWSNDYQHLFRPESQEKLDEYINTRVYTRTSIENASYARINKPIKVNLPLSEVMNYNYVRVKNPAQPITGDVPTSYYYFILGANYNAPNTTEIIVELDVFQTFGYGIKFGRSFVERSHMLMAATNRYRDYGAYYLTENEGLDLGGDMRPIQTYKESFIAEHAVISSTNDMTTNPGTSTAPRPRTAKGSRVQGMYSAIETHVLRAGALASYMQNMSVFPWVTRGITSIVIMPDLAKFKREGDNDSLSLRPTITLPNGVGISNVYPPSGLMRPLEWGRERASIKMNNVAWRDHIRENMLPADVSDLDKFFTFPYMSLEVTFFNGDPVTLNPELWRTDHLELDMLISIMPGNERLTVVPKSYNGSATNDLTGEFLDAALSYTSFPRLPVVNDGAALALASTVGARHAQRTAIQWGYAKAQASNRNQWENAGIGIDMSGQLSAIAQNQTTQSTELNIANREQQWLYSGIGGIAQGGALGLGAGAGGGPGGAAIGAGLGIGMGAANMLTSGMTNSIQAGTDRSQAALANASAAQANSVQGRAANAIRDNNYGLASYAARGDYQQAIAALNAQTKDLAMTPPQMSGQQGGDMFNIIHNTWGLFVRVRVPQVGQMRRIAAYWRRYGYTINRYETPPADLHCMSRFTYWKMLETTVIQGNLPEIFKNTIRGIFERGTTVWKNADDIGNISPLANKPLPGITMGD